jgi:transposase
VTPKACAPYRARTKGKDERGVGYVRGGPRQLDRFPSVLSVKPCGLSRL